jgi:hypothetical protein
MDPAVAAKDAKGIGDSDRELLLRKDKKAEVEPSTMQQRHVLVIKSIAHFTPSRSEYCKKATVRLFCRKAAIFGAGAIAKKQRPL